MMHVRFSALRKARAAVIAAAGVIGVGAVLVTPSALAGKVVPVTEPIELGNGICGAESGGAHIGTATFSRAKGKLQVDITLQGANANTTYNIHLWDGSTCTLIVGADGSVSTDGNGDGSGSLQAKVHGRVFFIDAIDPANQGDNDSLIATLG